MAVVPDKARLIPAARFALRFALPEGPAGSVSQLSSVFRTDELHYAAREELVAEGSFRNGRLWPCRSRIQTA